MAHSSYVEKSRSIIQQAFDRFGRVGLAWTTGKDSTTCLHLAKASGHKFPVIFIDTGDHFPETYQMVERLCEEWDLDFHAYTPKSQPDEDEASRTALFYVRKVAPFERAVRELDLGAVMVGIRWSEHEARSREKYFSERWMPEFGSHWRVHPILHWTEEQVWDYIRSNDVPYNPLYDRGYRSLDDATYTKPAVLGGSERSGREVDKEHVMDILRSLGYF